MALSANESALLTETCTNMNIAANTCREALEMLRSLGNTGVVDIATHNNAETPHADAANLVHIVSNNMVMAGVQGVGGRTSITCRFSTTTLSAPQTFCSVSVRMVSQP